MYVYYWYEWWRDQWFYTVDERRHSFVYIKSVWMVPGTVED